MQSVDYAPTPTEKSLTSTIIKALEKKNAQFTKCSVSTKLQLFQDKIRQCNELIL